MSENSILDSKKLLNTLKVLYVEDDVEAMQELSHFLKKRVASLSVAQNGIEALDAFDRQGFDAIICDLWMPEMDGMTFVKTIRELGHQTPVIITSAFSDIETVLQAVDLGIVKYCVKPIEVDELLGSLERIALDRLENASKDGSSYDLLLNREERLDLEKKLKSGFAYLLKSLTGKGPKQVHLALGTSDLEIWATDVHSQIEKSLLDSDDHAGIVHYLRRAIYSSYKEQFETMVAEALNRSAVLEEVRSEIDENTDRLVFRLN